MTKLNICVPYRNMASNLKNFLDAFIVENNQDITLLIVEQSEDGRRFNLGKLTNVGYHFFQTINKLKDSIYMFHPVDIIPQKFSQYIDYINKIPDNGILCLYDEINQPDTTFYKACMYTNHALHATNGYPNNFWGWGSEDRCFLSRIDYMKIQKIFMDFGPTTIRARDPSPDRFIDYEDILSCKICNMSDIEYDGLSSLLYSIQDISDIATNIKKITVKL